jgi:hypothetical protein
MVVRFSLHQGKESNFQVNFIVDEICLILYIVFFDQYLKMSPLVFECFLELFCVTAWTVCSDWVSNLSKTEVIHKQMKGTSMQEK